MTHRTRAWRRRQRALHIERRRHRIPDWPAPWPVQLWQLHTPDGEPTPRFHREVVRPPDLGSTTELPVEVRDACIAELMAAPAPEPRMIVAAASARPWEPDRSPPWRGGELGWEWRPVRRTLPRDPTPPPGPSIDGPPCTTEIEARRTGSCCTNVGRRWREPVSSGSSTPGGTTSGSERPGLDRDQSALSGNRSAYVPSAFTMGPRATMRPRFPPGWTSVVTPGQVRGSSTGSEAWPRR